MAENYYLLLTARSLAEGRQSKNYLLRIYLSGNATPIQIENSFTHNYEYVFKLWPCDLNGKQSIQIQMFEKFINQANREILVKRGESKPEVHCTIEGQKFKFYGEQEKSVLILHFRVESTRSIERQMSNEKLKQMNHNMQQHLNTCKQQLKQYQDFLIYTNNVIKELNQPQVHQNRQPIPRTPKVVPQDNMRNNEQKQVKQILQTQRENKKSEPNGSQIRVSIKSQPKKTGRQLSTIEKNEQQPLPIQKSNEPKQSQPKNTTKSLKFTSSPQDQSSATKNEGKETSLRLKLNKDSARSQESSREKTLLSKYRYLERNYQSIDTIRDENESQQESEIDQAPVESKINKMIPEKKKSQQKEVLEKTKLKDKSSVRFQQNSQPKKIQKTKSFSVPKSDENKIDLAQQIRKRRQQYFGRAVEEPQQQEEVNQQSKALKQQKDSPINKLTLSNIQNESIFLKKELISKDRISNNKRNSRNEAVKNQLYVDEQKQALSNEKVLNSFKQYEKQYKKKYFHVEAPVSEPNRVSTISKPRQTVKAKEQPTQYHQQEIIPDNKSTIVRQSAFPSSNTNKKTLQNNSTKLQEDSTFRNLSRRKKTVVNRENGEKERTTMGRDEQYKKQSFTASKTNQQLTEKPQSANELSLCRLKAVLFTNNRSLPKRCLVEFEGKTFQTNVKESEGNTISWSTDFHLQGIKEASFMHCTVISSQDNRVKEEGQTLIKGSDILNHRGSIIKAYLYKDELAVGYLELQFMRGINKTDRKTISLPEIKKRSTSELDSFKKTNQLPSMRAKTQQDISVSASKPEKKKLSTISQCDSSQIQEGSLNSQKSSLSRLKERKLRLKAKMLK